MFRYFADYDTDSITSSERAVIQTPDQSEGATNSTFGSDFGEQESAPPLPLEIEKLTSDLQKKDMVSSYENVYTGADLDPTVNRMSMDASEMDIGDRFDTKQPEIHHQQIGKSSSYEELYEAEKVEVEGEGEFKSESTSASSIASGQSTSVVPSVVSSHYTNGRTCPIYITVESGLDKLACDSLSSQVFSAYDGQGVKLKLDVVERSMSCETDSLDDRNLEAKKLRHRSSPDMYSPTDASTVSPFEKGTFSTTFFDFRLVLFSIL